ncbi:MAG: carbamoyltransferase [Nitrospirales bacterium]
MNIIGISGLHHTVQFKKRHFPDLTAREYRIAQGFDSAAALVTDHGVAAAVAEERFIRDKATHFFPIHAIRYCLEAAGISAQQISSVAHGFAYQPVKSAFEFEALSQQQYAEVYDPARQIECLQEHFPSVDWTDKLVSVPHHLAHAASTFYLSGFEEALIVITDGMGELNSMTALIGDQKGLHIIQEIPAFHSLGILYGVFTLYLGFDFGMDEYKVMGLAPYGNARRYFNRIMEFVHLKHDGTYVIPLFAHNKSWEETETHRGVLKTLTAQFGPSRHPDADLTQQHMDIAAGLQAVFQTCQLHLLKQLKQRSGQYNLCMAGGTALNCTVNGEIQRSRLFRNMFIQPAAGDDGTALGAALYVQYGLNPHRPTKKMAMPFWGPAYPEFLEEPTPKEIMHQDLCEYRYFASIAELTRNVAHRLAQGQVIAWFQGPMEFGPRALGNRSILADPRQPAMRNHVNHLIKKREGFRPFAPAVMAEAAIEFFEINKGEEDTFAHMLYVVPVRLQYRSKLPAITHVDGSARVQTVRREHNERFWCLLSEFGRLTGMPILLNTSFNVRGQPIVCTPTEAIETFLEANLDALVLGNYMLGCKDRGKSVRLDISLDVRAG